MVRLERDKLPGLVELDETVIGWIRTGKFGNASDKAAVMIATEPNDSRRLGRVRLVVADRPATSPLVDVARP